MEYYIQLHNSFFFFSRRPSSVAISLIDSKTAAQIEVAGTNRKVTTELELNGAPADTFFCNIF